MTAALEASIARWHDQAVDVDAITAAVTAFNHRLFARTWELVASSSLQRHACLIVMGSEGRGEQILKTDQDNGLLLPDDRPLPGLDAATRDFSDALSAFGYPPCPGGNMLTEPLWCRPLAAFRNSITDWIRGNDPEGAMRLAIFFDAVAVAGDGALLDAARRHLRLFGTNDAFLARFAAAVEQFGETAPWWRWLSPGRDSRATDIKKRGLFPIVHGTRALALRHGVEARGTSERLRLLADGGHLEATLADALRDAMHLLMSVRLGSQLGQRAAGRTPDNLIDPGALDSVTQHQLVQALEVVGRFRRLLRQQFRLDML